MVESGAEFVIHTGGFVTNEEVVIKKELEQRTDYDAVLSVTEMSIEVNGDCSISRVLIKQRILSHDPLNG